MQLPFHFDENRLVVLVFTIVVFLIDINLPFGFSIGMLYMIGILFIRISSKTFIFGLCLLMSIFVLIKLLLYYPNFGVSVFVNRLFTIIVICSTGYFKLRNFNLFLSKKEFQAKKEMRDKQYDNLIESMIEGAQLISQDWKYIYVNTALLDQIDMKADELVGKTMFDVFPGIENTPLFGKLLEARSTRKPVRFENEFKFPNGKIEVFELNVQPMDENLFILSMLITERKKMEKERLSYTKSLEDMLFHTSHKVRQPVSNIVGLANDLKFSKHLDENDKTSINYIKRSALKLEVFTNELNDLIIKSKVRDSS